MSNNFIIQGEGMGLLWIKQIHKFILNNAFSDKQIIYDTTKMYPNPDLVIRSTHEWYKNRYEDFINPPSDPQNPFFEYLCPYISWSGEPLRCKIRDDRLPIYEINTYIKDATTSKNVGPYDPKIMEDTIWWGKQRYYFDNVIPTHWIPYMLISPFIEAQMDLLNIRQLKYTVKKYNFVYIASNCTQQVREKLFEKLKASNGDNSDEKRLARAYGRCQNTESGKSHPQDTRNWADNYKIYNDFKFVFAIENSINPGYITEKILLAFQGSSVPIYYGSNLIKNYFNEKAFYYMNDKMADPQNPTDAELNAIASELEILANDDNETTGWKKFLKEPVWKDNKPPEFLKYDQNTQWIKDLGKEIRTKYDESIFKMPENNIADNLKKLSKISFEMNKYDVKNIKEHNRINEKIKKQL